MTKDFHVIMSLDALKDDIVDLVKEISTDTEVKDVEITETMGIGEAIVISIVSSLIVEIMKKTPAAIDKFKKYIQKLLRRGRKVSKEPQKMRITVQHELLTLEFSSGTEGEFNREFEKLWSYIKS